MSDLKEKFKKIARKYETGKHGYYDSLQEAYDLSQQENKQKIEALIEKYKYEADNYFNVAASQVLRDLKKLIE